MWGLIYENLVPVAPDPALLKEFYNCFDDVEEIQEVTNSTIKLIPETDVITLRGTNPGRKKHPDEKLSDKQFSEKYWEQVTQEYNLLHEIAVDEDDDESSSDYEDVESDSSIDMDVSSDDDSEDEGNNMIDEDETMEDSEAVCPSNAEYGFDWENWK
ncbi:hypothetical protein O181_041467 [Austropuccinia psidii MF-1]|uniref:Uncharacterized protein n=1 Tax=Austropuccinia psidii MF-1 TaxID=1389203 RepID=A0A9Q3DKU0_9BASI|nr:hypothetical protein [Austropuccinia psidii MF-1]